MSVYKNDPTHTYLDINIVNNKLNLADTAPLPIIFNTRRNADYLTNPQDYYVSVIRWSMDCRLPVIIPQLKLDTPYSTDAEGVYYETEYIVSIQAIKTGHATAVGTAFVKFRTEMRNEPSPVISITSLAKCFDNPYFYISSVQHFLRLVNDAYDEAWANLKTDWGAGFPFIDAKPFIQYDYAGGFSLNATNEFLSTRTAAAGICEIYNNGSIYTLFNGLASLVNGYVGTDKNYLLIFSDANQTTTINGQLYLYSLTEYPCVPFWSPISSIVFQTQGIPVEPTNTNPTVIYGNPTALGAVNDNINLSSIITDFDINLQTGLEPRQINYYAPSSEYRMFDLNSNRPLADISIIAGWRDKLSGTVHSIYLYSGGAATLKLLFRKRDFYSATS